MIEDFSVYLNKISSGKKIILIGEIHGTKEIPKLLTQFFSDHIKQEDFDIHLEFPSSEQSRINTFLDNGKKTLLKNIFDNIKENDGRRTLEYMKLIERIYELNNSYNKSIRIICIDVDESNIINSKDFQNEREKILAKNILNNLNKKTFVILGSIHASKKIIESFGLKIIPAGNQIYKKLNEDFININLVPKKGKFYNNGIKEIDTSLEKFNHYYDHIFLLESVSPATLL